MYRIEKIMMRILMCFCVVFLYGCGYEPEYFPKEELLDYRSPVLFLSSRENSEKYFIMLDQPDNRIDLDYDEIWDYDSTRQTFLFSMSEEEDKIYEYDLKSGSYQCILEGTDVGQVSGQQDEEGLRSIFYHFSDHQISGMYGAKLFVYNLDDDKVIYEKELPDAEKSEICAWINPKTYLYRVSFDIFEVSLDTGGMKQLGDEWVYGCVLSKDKTMGCSNGVGEEQWNGGSFTPILVWDTSDYQTKRFKEGISTGARMQISDDNKYIMVARSNAQEDSQLLCIRIEDGKVCTVYETPDDFLDLLW